MRDELKKLPLQDLTKKLAVERSSSVYAIEIRRSSDKEIDVQLHATFDIREGALTQTIALEALVLALRSSLEMYEAELRALQGSMGASS